jgi:hypothetical protein
MRRNLFISILLASALGGTGFAQTAPANPPTGATASQDATPAVVPIKHGYDPDTVICKWTDQIGTRLGRSKVCLTRAQWEQQTRDAQDDLFDSTRRGGEGGVPGG